jgi:hypothetical protein
MKLDDYTAVAQQDGQCMGCGLRGTTLRFTGASQASTHPTLAVCGTCLLWIPGRFRNDSPATVLRQYERVDAVRVFTHHVSIETSSQLGAFTHVHYLDTAASVEENELTGDDIPAVRFRGVTTGTSEIFGSNGEYLAGASPYTALAARAVARADSDSRQTPPTE